MTATDLVFPERLDDFYQRCSDHHLEALLKSENLRKVVSKQYSGGDDLHVGYAINEIKRREVDKARLRIATLRVALKQIGAQVTEDSPVGQQVKAILEWDKAAAEGNFRWAKE